MPVTIAVSASESPDITAFGLSEGHLRDAMADLAAQLLAADIDIAYGGDLREHGFAKLLFELVRRYTPVAELDKRTRVTSYLPWPAHITMPIERIERFAEELRGSAKLVLVSNEGTRMTIPARRRLPATKPTVEEWVSGLTAMRGYQRSCTDARVALGGQVAGYKGRMPGVAEEALLSIRACQPLFLLGGFGGAARDIAEALGLAEPWIGSRRQWSGQQEFEDWTGNDLNNGLSREENETLVTTPFIGQAIVMVLRGLCRLKLKAGCVRGTREMTHAHA